MLEALQGPAVDPQHWGGQQGLWDQMLGLWRYFCVKWGRARLPRTFPLP